MSALREAAAARRTAQQAYEAAVRQEYQILLDDLVERRKAAGLTQQEIADACSVTRAQISNVEGGRIRGSVETLLGYAAALGGHLTFQEGS